MNTKEIYDFLNIIAPVELAEPWDNVGLLVEGDADIKSVLVCLDITASTVDEAIANNCGLIVSHHPVIFKPFSSIKSTDIAFMLVKNNISAICMHTNLDTVQGGVNDILAKTLSLSDVTKLDCGGRVGNVPTTTVVELAEKCKKIFNQPIRYTSGDKIVNTVAVVGGAGAFLNEAVDVGADCLVTGDVKHHDGIDAIGLGLGLIGAGHFATEFLVVDYLVEQLAKQFPTLDIIKCKTNKEPFNTI